MPNRLYISLTALILIAAPFTTFSMLKAKGSQGGIIKELAEKNDPRQDSTGNLSEIARRVKIEKIPAANVLSLPVTGSYDQHPRVLNQLMTYATKNYAFAGTWIGIYPIDPDAVGAPFAKVHDVGADRRSNQSKTAGAGLNAGELKWEVAIRVIPGNPGTGPSTPASQRDPFRVEASELELVKPLSRLRKASAPFVLKRLPAVTAVVLETDVRRSAADGLALYAWIVQNGYIQIAPTRMELAMTSTDPASVLTKIVVPVKKRASGLTVK